MSNDLSQPAVLPAKLLPVARDNMGVVGVHTP